MIASNLQFPGLSRCLAFAVGLVVAVACGVEGFSQAAVEGPAEAGVEAAVDFNNLVAETSSIQVEAGQVADPRMESPCVESACVESACVESADDQIIMTQNSCRTSVPVRVSSRDEIWLVSARAAECFPCDPSRLQCCLLQNGTWQPSTLSELVGRHTSDKTKATLIYVHGNRTDLGYAKARGLQVYQAAFQAPACARPPIRLVLFAWKSEKEIRRPVTDFDVKSDRAVVVGKIFSQLLGQFEDRNIAIMGFSLGTQVVLSGLTCAESHEPKTRSGQFRVALIAPALDPGFVRSELPDFPNNSLVKYTHVYRNENDRAIKLAQSIVRRQSRSNITSLRQLAGLSKTQSNPITNHDITCEISKRHSITRYCISRSMRTGLAEMLFDVVHSAAVSNPAVSDPVVESVDVSAQ